MSFRAIGLLTLCVAAAGCGGSSSPTQPTSASTTPSTPSGGGGTVPSTSAAVAYVQDVKPILDTDCVRCHGSARRDGGVDVSSYTAVMRTVVAGSASSPLVRTTQSGGAMYGYWSGDRASKAELVRTWVVANGAVESR